jgi:hypothetical protein
MSKKSENEKLMPSIWVTLDKMLGYPDYTCTCNSNQNLSSMKNTCLY